MASSLGGEPGHEPGREPERRPGCGLGTEPWRELLLLLENCQTANTLTQVPEGARFTLEAERGKPKDTMTMKLDLNACPDIPRSKRGGQGSPECPPRDLPPTASMSKHAAWVRRRATERALRGVAGLGADGSLPPAPELFQAQAQAIECRHSLVQSEDYRLAQMRFFAEETFEGGKRRVRVDTFAGFALA